MHFDFEVPASFFEKAEADKGKQRRIGGVISCETRDRQKEVILAKGLELNDFLRNGWFNDNHSKKTVDILGYPEITKYISQGSQMPDGRIAKADGHWVEGYLLDTPEADKIWELGKALQKTHRRLGFSVEGKILKRAGDDKRTIAKAMVRNVAITNCFPGDVAVNGVAEDITRRPYLGPMVEIMLATGEKLTGTPNHPVFTQRGWVALGVLQEGHDRIGRFNGDLVGLTGPTGVVSHDKQDVPATLNELFHLAANDSTGIIKRICPVREGDFHGDVLTDGEINVVPIKGELKGRFDSLFFQKFGENALTATDKEAFLLAREGALFHLLVARSCATARNVRRASDFSALGRGALTVSEKLFFAAIAGYAKALCDMEHCLSGDFIAFGDAGRTLADSVSFSDLSGKRIFEFSGHVYNLSTEHGWFSANGIVAHNCPVNTDSRMEILARSLEAIEQTEPDVLEKMLGMGDCSSGETPQGTQTGMGAGQVLTKEDLEKDEKNQKEKKKKTKKSLMKSEAFGFVRARLPNATDRQIGRLLTLASRLKRQAD